MVKSIVGMEENTIYAVYSDGYGLGYCSQRHKVSRLTRFIAMR
jgi:hypothetical protein